MSELPYLTAALPGIGGALRTRDADFFVDETPAYLPAGAGDHVMIHVEKRGLTTQMALEAIARAVGVSARDVGVAGQKDRRAVTRQWLSLPPPCTPEQALALALPDLTILAAARHGNKLRTGHVRSNAFVLRVRGVADAAAAETHARAILAELTTPPGALNWYAEQRFGRDGDNAQKGRDLLAGRRAPARHPRGQKLDRLFLSALQSELFNEWLRRRLADGLYRQVLAGDVLHKTGGGMFVCDDPSTDQARLQAGEVGLTGPMFGVDMRGATPGTDAAAREAAVLADAGLELAAFAPFRRIAGGTRRDAAIAVEGASAARDGDDVVVRFTLPSGAYATAVMREVMKIVPLDAPVALPTSTDGDDGLDSDD